MDNREQFTLRVPAHLLQEAREEAAVYGKSVNEVLIDVISVELRHRQLRRAQEAAKRVRASICGAPAPAVDSTEVIRALREARSVGRDA